MQMPRPSTYIMSPPYSNMNGKNLKIISGTGHTVGQIVTFEDDEGTKFGIRVDITHQPQKEIKITQSNDFEVYGCFDVEMHSLDQQQINNIKLSDDSDSDYTLRI